MENVDLNTLIGILFVVFFFYLLTRKEQTKSTTHPIIVPKLTYNTVKKQKEAKRQKYLDLEDNFRRHKPPSISKIV